MLEDSELEGAGRPSHQIARGPISRIRDGHGPALELQLLVEPGSLTGLAISKKVSTDEADADPQYLQQSFSRS